MQNRLAMQVVCVIVLECKSVLHVLHVRYMLVSKAVAGGFYMLTHGCGNTCDPVYTWAGPTLVSTRSLSNNG